MKHPVPYNLELTLADTEYKQELSVRTRNVFFKNRGNVDIRYAYKPGFVATPTAPYMTLDAGNSRSIPLTGSVTLYFACGLPGKIVEIEITEQ
jgi:hypothetical protein